MGVQHFLVRQAAKWQLRDAPAAQREQLLAMLEKDPALMKQIGEEIERRTKKGGESQMKATMEVMRKYQKELAGLTRR